MAKIKKALPLGGTGLLFILMMLYSSAAVSGAGQGIKLCINVIIPTLLPFFVLSNLLCSLGLPGYLGRFAEGLFRSLFGVGGAGASAFILGLTGGYPLGAASVSEMYRAGSITKDEAQKLIMFCNNTGPAFIMGMAGVGVFHSAKAGLLLYIAHILAAALTGIALCGGEKGKSKPLSAVCALDLGSAITESMLRAMKSTAMICGYIIFFSMLTSLMQQSGLYTLFVGFLCERTPLSVGQSRSVILGILELGSGIASMGSLLPTPDNMALCAFILGWGGICVQFQTMSVLNKAGLPCSGAIFSKALHGVLSAAIAFAFAHII